MKEKLLNAIKLIYGYGATIAMFAGGLPLIPFIIALVIGGETGAAIADWLYNTYYPIVIIVACGAVVVGLIGLYISGKHGLMLKDPDSGKDAQ